MKTVRNVLKFLYEMVNFWAYFFFRGYTRVHKNNIMVQAKCGNLKVLKHPDCSTFVDDEGMTALHWLSVVSDKKEITMHPDFTEVIGNSGMSPIEYMAYQGKTVILSHPKCSKYLNSIGQTALHILAYKHKTELIEHPDCLRVVDGFGKTPVHNLAKSNILKKKHLKKLFPWYTFKGNKIDEELIDKLIKTPNSVRFIKEKE